MLRRLAVILEDGARSMDPRFPVKDDKGHPLACYGCGHSAGGEPYPSFPSGERPCAFCIRNPDQAANLADVKSRITGDRPYTARYDNGPTRGEVGDQYISTYRVSRDLPEGTTIIT